MYGVAFGLLVGDEDGDKVKNNKFAYDPEQIEYTLQNDCPSLRILSRYQKLTPYICAKYVIFGGPNEDNGDCVEDRYLDTYDILRLQPHLTMEDMNNAFQMVDEELEMERNDYNVNIF